MGKLKRAILLSFRTKVIVPVVVVMVLLIAISTWLVNVRVTSQLQADAVEKLATSEDVFKYLQEFRSDQLLRRYLNVANEPRFKATAGQTDLKTFRALLDELLRENIRERAHLGERPVLADVISFSTDSNDPVTVARDPQLNIEEFETACANAVNQAANGQPKVDLVRNGDRLFDIVSVPVRVGDNVVGAVTFGVKNSVAQEFNRLTHSELLVLSDGSPLASTLRRPDLQSLVTEQLASSTTTSQAQHKNLNPIREITAGNEHFLCLSGSLSSPGGPHQLTYLILSSREKQLEVLRETQRTILAVGALAILLGTTIIWFLIRRVVEPLEELRDSVEAVGQGDLSRRIEVSSMDECGELAEVFNQMTENLRLSREQLEATVETLRTTQAQLIQSEKLSGIGQFVAGVAHELNNPLTSVMGFSELLQQRETEPQQKRHLEMIHKSALRCQKIVQSLLSFARRHQPERKLVCVNSLVEAAVEILQYQMRTSNIEVITQLHPRLPQAMVDPHQIQQVFLNIINNARQAIEAHRPQGLVHITTDTCGTNVRILFEDNGPGIPEDSLSKVFDPFFTTKEIGKGTGLGLSLCYGMVREHGGSISVRSKPGQGATFVVELPIAAPATATPEKTTGPLVDLPDPKEGAGRRVLVIDDEEPILQMVSEALGRCGYDVDVASDGETALQRLRQRSYDLALCDWKMPGLNGQQIYERVRAANPAQSNRMIFITGDVINEKSQEFLRKQNKVCLSKPFSLAEFRNAINQALVSH